MTPPASRIRNGHHKPVPSNSLHPDQASLPLSDHAARSVPQNSPRGETESPPLHNNFISRSSLLHSLNRKMRHGPGNTVCFHHFAFMPASSGEFVLSGWSSQPTRELSPPSDRFCQQGGKPMQEDVIFFCDNCDEEVALAVSQTGDGVVEFWEDCPI